MLGKRITIEEPSAASQLAHHHHDFVGALGHEAGGGGLIGGPAEGFAEDGTQPGIPLEQALGGVDTVTLAHPAIVGFGGVGRAARSGQAACGAFAWHRRRGSLHSLTSHL